MKTYILSAALLAAFFVQMRDAHAIPAFARAYNVSCSTCHTVLPRRNEFGEAFRMLGYRWPKVGGPETNVEKSPEDRLTSQEMRGNSLFQTLLPEKLPFSLVTTGFATLTGRNFVPKPDTSFQYIFLLLDGAGALSDHISWNASVDLVTPMGTPTVLEAYATFNQLGDRPELNVRVGYLEPWTVTYKANNQILLKDFYFNSASPVMAARYGAELNGVIAERGFYAVSVLRNGPTSPYTNVAYRVATRLGGSNLLGEDLNVSVDDRQWYEPFSITLANWGFFGRNNNITFPGMPAVPGVPSGPTTTDLRRYGADILVNYENVAQVYGSFSFGQDTGLPGAVPDVPHINSTLLLAEALYNFTPWIGAMYMYQYSAASMQPVIQHHTIGVNFLPIENLRATLTGTVAANDAFMGDRVLNLQLYMAL